VIAFASTFFMLDLDFRIRDAPWLRRYLPIDEEHTLSPEDTYRLSKLMDEEMLEAYTRAWGMRSVACRLLGEYYAHRDDSATRFRREAKPPPQGKPPAFRAWQYLDGRDAAQAFRLANESKDLVPFYLASDRTIEESRRDALARLFPELREMAAELGPDDGLISIEKAKRKLGYQPWHSWSRQALLP